MTSGNAGDALVPAARFEHLVATESGDDVLVYDTGSHHIHHLNAVSAAVWRLCDGQRSVDEVASAASIALGHEVSAETVRFTLGKLADARLLVESTGEARWGPGQSRRSFLRKAAVAGAVPVVVSLTVPSAAAALSGTCGQLCESSDDCVEGPCPDCGNFFEDGNLCCGDDFPCTA